jgi:AcrR family transcriptional regulator
VPRAKQRTPELRERVLQVALDTLAREGVAGFTTRSVAHGAATSPPAVYELFGDKAGLVREVFFEGFRLLGRRLEQLEPSADPRADLVAMIGAVRAFVRERPVLTEVMFSRPFADFDPGPSDLEAGSTVRGLVIRRVKRCVDEGVLAGDETDIAHALLALTLGLAAAETASRLGTSKASVDRRWRLAVQAMLDGFGPARIRQPEPR